MIMADIRPRPLIERLPQVRGRLTAKAPLAGITWFRVGGPAEVMFRPADRDDLQHFLAGLPADVPVTVIGVGSNLLVRDGGVPGVVLRLGRGFAEIAHRAGAYPRRRRGPRPQRRAHGAPRPASPASNSSPAFRAPSAARCA